MEYIILDIETTGLDIEHSSIIEVGTLLIKEGVVQDSFSSLVRYEGELPETAKRITGITEDMLQDAPQMSAVIRDLKKFIGKRPVVAHNGFSFDFPILERYGLKFKEKYDSMEFAFFVLPTNTFGHSMATLAEQLLGIKNVPHRALEDCKLEFKVMNKLQNEYDKKPEKHREILKYMAEFTQWWWSNFLPGNAAQVDRISSLVASYEPLRREKEEQEAEQKSEPKIKKVELAKVDKYFSSSGPSSNKDMDYSEDRPEQRSMASLVANAFNANKHAVIEAGTGIGKSKAYLVPALLFALENKIPIIISTHTKALQDQLSFKEILHLRDSVYSDVVVAVLKGKKNYVCLQKFDEFVEEVLASFSQRSLYEFRQSGINFSRRLACVLITSWVLATERGDWDELPYWLKERIPKQIEQEICNLDELCGNNTCDLYDGRRCFLVKARLRARDADIAIVNHALMLSGIILESEESRDDDDGEKTKKVYSHTVLPAEAKFIVFDESHYLENDATSAWEHILSESSLNLLLKQLYGERGVLSLITSIARSKSSQRLSTLIDEFKFSEGDTKLIIQNIFRDILPQLVPENKSWEPSAYSMIDEISKTSPARKALMDLLKDLWVRLRIIAKNIDIFSEEADTEKLKKILSIKANGVRRIVTSLAAMTNDDKIYVRYLERRSDNIEIKAAPLSVARHLKEYVYDNFSSVILTSATLTVNKSFKFFRDRCGTRFIDKNKIEYHQLKSSFDYEKQVKFFVPKGIAYAGNSSAHFEKSVNFLEEAVIASGGGSLILCSSHDQVAKLYEKLVRPLSENNIWLLRQVKGTSVSSAVRDFKKDADSVLIGTETLWQGIDIPGESLRSLFIYKIPYRMPSFPLVKARRQELEANGKDSFSEYYEPLAALILKQGFGRLIRKSTDIGIVVLLDENLLHKPRLLHSLPDGVHPQAAEPEEIYKALYELYNSLLMKKKALDSV